MFQTGDLIIYGGNGVCKVLGVGAPEGGRNGNNGRLYYTLQPLYNSETIYTPVDTSIFMRPVISREQAEELVAQIPSIDGEICTERSLTQLKWYYESSLQSHDCRDLVQLIKGVYSKNKNAIQKGKKPGQVDQRYMKRAEDLLYGELAAALDIPRDYVLNYISDAAVVTAQEN